MDHFLRARILQPVYAFVGPTKWQNTQSSIDNDKTKLPASRLALIGRRHSILHSQSDDFTHCRVVPHLCRPAARRVASHEILCGWTRWVVRAASRCAGVCQDSLRLVTKPGIRAHDPVNEFHGHVTPVRHVRGWLAPLRATPQNNRLFTPSLNPVYGSLGVGKDQIVQLETKSST
jgi:hypothetical protein